MNAKITIGIDARKPITLRRAPKSRGEILFKRVFIKSFSSLKS